MSASSPPGPALIEVTPEPSPDTGQGTLGDTWLWDGSTWTQDNVAGPSARAYHGMATLNGTVVLFGGCLFSDWDCVNTLSDTWTWNGASWTVHNVVGPSARSGFAMTTLNDTVVLFGGQSAGTLLGDTWTWDGASWTNRNVAGPSPRHSASMAALNGTVVLFGGWDGTSNQDDVWTWNGTSWTKVANGSVVVARVRAPMATFSSTVVMYGGFNADFLGDTATWNGTSWTEFSVTGARRHERPPQWPC